MDDLWEIELTRDKWVPVDAAMRAAIADAVNSTSNSGQFEARGFSYEVDLNAMVQRNKSTQRTRPIRRKQSAAAQEHEAPPPAAATAPPPVAATAPPPATAEEREASPPAAARKRARVAADSLSTPPAAAAAASSAGASPGATPDSPEGIAPSSDNDHLASIFEQMGAIKKLQKDTFRATAYQKAAAALRAHPSAVVSGKEARGIAGIGKGMAERIDKVLESGHLPELEELKRDTDVVALRELQLVHGVGAVRAGALIGQGIRTLDGLRAAVAGGSVSLDPAQRIGLRHAEEFRQKIPRAEARRHEEALLSARDASLPAMQLVVCGSYRRGKATSGDIDALVTPTDGATPASLLARWVDVLRESGYVTDTLAQGPSKFMGVCRLPDGMHRRLDLRSVPPEQFHFATLYFTGSNLLNVKMRLRAIELGMTLNEYRLERKPAVDGQEGEAVPAGSEREVFEALGMDYLEPHERG